MEAYIYHRSTHSLTHWLTHSSVRIMLLYPIWSLSPGSGLIIYVFNLVHLDFIYILGQISISKGI